MVSCHIWMIVLSGITQYDRAMPNEVDVLLFGLIALRCTSALGCCGVDRIAFALSDGDNDDNDLCIAYLVN